MGALHAPVPGDGIEIDSWQAVGPRVQRQLVVDLRNRDLRLCQP